MSYGKKGYFQYLLFSKGCNSKRKLTRAMCFLLLFFFCVCSAHCLMVLCICEKFHNNILNGFQLTEGAQVHGRNGYVQHSKGNNSKHK